MTNICINSSNKKNKFTESEQELYDVLLDEYNDIFEQILNRKEKYIFDKILINAKAILGEKKMEEYSKSIITKVLSDLKRSNYIPDMTSLKSFKKKYLLPYKNNNKLHKIPKLEIDDIFAHCKECSKCYHICGEVLLKPSKFDFIICIQCNMVYKSNLIHLYCQECNEEYYSYIVDDSEPDYDNYYPATWEKYHCPNYIYEEMSCPKCEAMLYYNEDNQLLKCFECNWKCNSNNKKWICELCNAEFTSSVKEYIRFETKPLVNCVRDALVQKVPAHPPPGRCCGVDPTELIFKHIDKDNEKRCNGILYFGHLQKKEVVVCSECRLVQQMKNVYWECPKCFKIFSCKKKKQNLKKMKHNSNNNITKIKSLLKDEKISIFQPKKIHGFQKSEKKNFNSNEKISNYHTNDKIYNYAKIRKMDKSNTSSEIEPVNKIISKNIKPLNNTIKKYNITKIKNIDTSHNNKSNEDDDNNDSITKNDGNISDSENFSDENKSNNNKSNIKSKSKSGFTFYKKPTNNLYNNIVKVKRKEKSENVSFNNDFNEKCYQTAKNVKFPNFFVKKKEPKEIHNRNLSLKDMKILSLRNQKYISKSKLKFAKYSNENSLISIKNNHINTDNNVNNSESKNKNVSQIKTKLIHSGKKISLNLNLNININNFVDRSPSNKNSTIENNLRANSLNKNDINANNDNINNNVVNELEPNENFNPDDFTIIKQIGEGTFGIIYCSEWKENNKNYAMKKMILKKENEISRNKIQTDLVHNFLKKTNSNGVIKIYGSQCKKINNEYNFYVLMELAERDWEKEIKERKESKKYYTEGELYEITRQLIKTFALLQKNNITHRDIKPQNILIVNNIYKICDFGEAKITDGNSIKKHAIKGTELYMSPILFSALNNGQNYIIHNSFKSDVFSLGMCLLLAATLTFKSLYNIRELKDMNLIKNVLEKYLIVKYSYNFVNILVKMLEVNENLRPDFIELDVDLYQK